PTLPGWEIAACYRPVIEVGGDIYGWLPIRNDRWLFWIADATGHGASAALLTTLAKLLFHHGNAEQEGPAAIMEAVNNDLRGLFGAAKNSRPRTTPTQLAGMINPFAASAEALLELMLKAAAPDAAESPRDDVAALVVRRSN